MTSVGPCEPAYRLAEREGPALFGRVVCGVDSSPGTREAVRQAAVLAGPGGRVVLVCVGEGREDSTSILRAIQVAEDLGAEPTAQLCYGMDPTSALLERVGPNDLLAVGSPGGRSRIEGILSGSVATALLHRAEGPVLIARAAPAARPFPRELLVASDGSPTSRDAVRLACAVARRYQAHVSHLHAGGDAGRRSVLTEEIVELDDAIGSPPVVLMEDEPAHHAIVARAAERLCSLVIVGSRGIGGVRALGSVSERVGHGAPCSVLVVRPPARGLT